MKTILFQGDSITDAGRDRKDNDLGHGYPTLVKAALGFEHPGEYRFFNRGVSGNRIVDIYSRMKSDIIDLRPDWISMLVGLNDVWHEFSNHNGIDPDKFERIYCLLIDGLLKNLPGVRVMLFEPFILPGSATCDSEEFPEKYRMFRERVGINAASVRRIAAKYSVPFIPLQARFDDACKVADASYWLSDGIHPTACGHELIKREWLKAFAGII